MTPKYYNAGDFANAENDVAGADLIQLSDNTYLRSGKVTWTGHGLTVGSWYYIDNTAGGYTSTQPNSDLIQKFFFVEDSNTIHVDIHQGYGFPYTTSLTTSCYRNFYGVI